MSDATDHVGNAVTAPLPRPGGIVTSGLEVSGVDGVAMNGISLVSSPRKAAGALVACVVTGGLVATAGLGSAPAANATCASFFGIGNSADCTSTWLHIPLTIRSG